MQPKVKFIPEASLLHQDGGNTGSQDYPGPLGNATNVSSSAVQLGVFLWGPDGSLTTGYVSISDPTSPKFGLAAVDPANLQTIATWFPPEANQTLQYAYMELEFESNSVVIPSKQGHIYVVSRQQCNGITELILERDIDLTTTISPGEQLLNSLYDKERNIWFTTGGIIGSGDPDQATCTIGYITPNGTIYAQHFQNQMPENGIALNGTKIYTVTGPSGAAFNTTNATGYMYALTTAAPGSSNPTILWSAPYSSGSELKPNGFARGSGSTPALLGDEYVVITDNSDEQINLIVYSLASASASSNDLQTHCTVPLFQKGASANEIAPAVHKEGSSYGVAIENGWHFPPLYKPGEDINGAFNNMTGMTPGVQRIDVNATGCETRWETPVRIKSVPVLSTETGLYYGYTQDEDLAVQGQYAWYVVAIDWDSGEEAWRVKTGAGGTFNDNFYPGALGPDGAFYQGVIGGVAVVRDGD